MMVYNVSITYNIHHEGREEQKRAFRGEKSEHRRGVDVCKADRLTQTVNAYLQWDNTSREMERNIIFHFLRTILESLSILIRIYLSFLRFKQLSRNFVHTERKYNIRHKTQTRTFKFLLLIYNRVFPLLNFVKCVIIVSCC